MNMTVRSPSSAVATQSVISVSHLSKIYESGFQALKDVLYGIFLASGIKSHQAFITMFHSVSIIFRSIVDIHGGCDSVLDHVFDGFGGAFNRSLDRFLL